MPRATRCDQCLSKIRNGLGLLLTRCVGPKAHVMREEQACTFLLAVVRHSVEGDNDRSTAIPILVEHDANVRGRALFEAAARANSIATKASSHNGSDAIACGLAWRSALLEKVVYALNMPPLAGRDERRHASIWFCQVYWDREVSS